MSYPNQKVGIGTSFGDIVSATAPIKLAKANLLVNVKNGNFYRVIVVDFVTYSSDEI